MNRPLRNAEAVAQINARGVRVSGRVLPWIRDASGDHGGMTGETDSGEAMRLLLAETDVPPEVWERILAETDVPPEVWERLLSGAPTREL